MSGSALGSRFVVAVAIVGAVVVGWGMWNLVRDDTVVMCGEPLVAVPGLRVVDFGDRFGEVVGVSRSVLPAGSQPLPAALTDVLVAPAGFAVEPVFEERGDGGFRLGSLRAEDGGCRIWVTVLTGDAMEPGVEDDELVEWYAVVVEGV